MIALRSFGHVLAASVAVLTLGCSNTASPETSGVGSRPGGAVAASKFGVGKQPVVSVTPKAVKSLTQFVGEQGITEPWYLRVGVFPGGCCGFMHKLDLDTELSPFADHTFESGGVTVVVLKRQVEMLRGTQVDFGEEREKQGFLIKNPNFEGESLKNWLPVLSAEVSPTPRPTPAQLGVKITRFRKMAKDDPENELAHYRLGQFLMEDEQYAEAVKSFERALELSPQFSKVYQLLGECLVKLDQKDRAVTVLMKGWSMADQRGDEVARNAMANLLSELGAAVPLEIPRRRSSK